jgi:hypothetical protein
LFIVQAIQKWLYLTIQIYKNQKMNVETTYYRFLTELEKTNVKCILIQQGNNISVILGNGYPDKTANKVWDIEESLDIPEKVRISICGWSSRINFADNKTNVNGGI